MAFWKKWFRKLKAVPAAGPLLPPIWLRFPQPPFRIDASLIDTAREARAGYIALVQTWRHEMLRALQPSGCRFDLTDWAQSSLLHFLRHDWNAMEHAVAEASAHNIAPFPIGAFDRDDPHAILDLLGWRAATDEYFSGVCAGPWPCPSSEECGAASAFLTPVGAEPLCVLCLTAFDDTTMPADAHLCLILPHVRAKWPAQPIIKHP